MIYKLKENEWTLLMDYYQNYIQRLSPVARIKISSILSTIEADKTITEIDQANAIISLLSASILEEETNTTDTTREQKRPKSGSSEQVESKDILILLDSLRLFLQCEITPDKCKQMVRLKNS